MATVPGYKKAIKKAAPNPPPSPVFPALQGNQYANAGGRGGTRNNYVAQPSPVQPYSNYGEQFTSRRNVLPGAGAREGTQVDFFDLPTAAMKLNPSLTYRPPVPGAPNQPAPYNYGATDGRRDTRTGVTDGRRVQGDGGSTGGHRQVNFGSLADTLALQSLMSDPNLMGSVGDSLAYQALRSQVPRLSGGGYYGGGGGGGPDWWGNGGGGGGGGGGAGDYRNWINAMARWNID